MKYKCLEPEVAGELGSQTIMDNSIHPPLVKKLHYQFSGWLGDDILESFPCYIITKKLEDHINLSNFTGVKFDDLIVTKGETFVEMNPDIDLPEFKWMQVTGQAGVHDFGLAKDFRLVISNNVFDLLSNFNIAHCDFEEWN